MISTIRDTVQSRFTRGDTSDEQKGYGTFKGVFTPTLLTILGVIMFLRQGSVVGNAGLLGAWGIITLAFIITATTALSMSSITTNIRIGAGGAYSIISQSLGLEVGGAIGIPLYLAQAIVVALYIFGFRDGWLLIFPGHPALVVDIVVFSLLFIIAYISANLAFRVQYLIMAIIAGSLISVFATVFTGALKYSPQWFGNYRGFPEQGFDGTNFWVVFAIFFPAATGILAGANMSGDLERPRRSIPIGVLSAIGVSFVIYMALAYWLASVATPAELMANYTIMVDRALWGPLVIAGLLGATFSSGLASLVGAPRIMQALGDHRILPASNVFSRRTAAGEPRNALLFTGVVVILALLLRDLNAIAPLVSMFFLITYAMINVVVLIEQSLGLVSFRPLFRVPLIIPLAGTIGTLGAMFIINPLIGLAGVLVVVVIYALLLRRRLISPHADLRSGLLIALAEWAARHVATLPDAHERSWKPNMLVIVEDGRAVLGSHRLIRDIIYPKGSLRFIGTVNGDNSTELFRQLPDITQGFQKDDLLASWTVIDSDAFSSDIKTCIQVLAGSFMSPNILFLPLPPMGSAHSDQELQLIASTAREQRIGTIFFAAHSQVQLGQMQTVNVWIRDRSPDWDVERWIDDLDLALLTGHQLTNNWQCELRLISGVDNPDDVEHAQAFLHELASLARFTNVAVYAESQSFPELLVNAPRADVNIFGLGPMFNLEQVPELVEQLGASCIFISDSGGESVLA